MALCSNLQKWLPAIVVTGCPIATLSGTFFTNSTPLPRWPCCLLAPATMARAFLLGVPGGLKLPPASPICTTAAWCPLPDAASIVGVGTVLWRREPSQRMGGRGTLEIELEMLNFFVSCGVCVHMPWAGNRSCWIHFRTELFPETCRHRAASSPITDVFFSRSRRIRRKNPKGSQTWSDEAPRGPGPPGPDFRLHPDSIHVPRWSTSHVQVRAVPAPRAAPREAPVGHLD